MDFTGYRPSFWFDTALVLVLLLYPTLLRLCRGEAPVMEIPVLLRRSARYVLVQRGFIVLMFLVAASAIGLFTQAFSRFPRRIRISAWPSAQYSESSWSGPQRRWSSAGTVRIDRAFFRSAYDLASSCTTLRRKRGPQATAANWLCFSNAREPGAPPENLRVLPRIRQWTAWPRSRNAPHNLETLSANTPVFVELARRGKPWEVRSVSAAPKS